MSHMRSDESMKERADKLLVRLGYFSSRAAAQAAITAGKVEVDGVALTKASQLVDEMAQILAKPVHPYVSRGGLKLAHALDRFGIEVKDRICLDIGASTGGFVDVLLRAGARYVYAVDVGRGQLHASLRDHPNVTNLEATDARILTAEQIPQPAEIIVCDASFVALEKIMDRPLSFASQAADFVGLFKPQFQVGRAHVGKGGIVTNDEAVSVAQTTCEAWLNEKGWRILAWKASPIKGGDGNSEHLFHARKSGAF